MKKSATQVLRFLTSLVDWRTGFLEEEGGWKSADVGQKERGFFSLLSPLYRYILERSSHIFPEAIDRFPQILILVPCARIDNRLFRGEEVIEWGVFSGEYRRFWMEREHIRCLWLFLGQIPLLPH